MNEIEQDIIDQAMDQLSKRLDLILKWEEKGPLDGRLTIMRPNSDLVLNTEVKREIRSYLIPQMEKHREENNPFLLAACRTTHFSDLIPSD